MAETEKLEEPEPEELTRLKQRVAEAEDAFWALMACCGITPDRLRTLPAELRDEILAAALPVHKPGSEKKIKRILRRAFPPDGIL